MLLLLSGEGKSDLGQVVLHRYEPGPWAWIADKIVESIVGYSILALHGVSGSGAHYVGESELVNPKPEGMALPGRKFGRGTAYFTKNAQALALRALQLMEQQAQPVVAILFRDSDGASTATRDEWRQKVSSMERGFKIEGFSNGVPMVPRPKSEAWVICSLHRNADADYGYLEEASGNDRSPNSLKRQLAAMCGELPSAECLTRWVETGHIDMLYITLPSFRHFRESLERVVKEVRSSAV